MALKSLKVSKIFPTPPPWSACETRSIFKRIKAGLSLEFSFSWTGWGCRIHQLHLCRGVRPLPNECLEYDTKQSDGEASVMLELWGMQSTPSVPSLPGPLWPKVVARDRVLFMGQIELFDIQTECKQMTYAKLNC